MSMIINPFFFGASGGGGFSGPDFPSIADEWARYEPFRETGYNDGDGIEPLTDWSGNGRDWTSTGADNTLPQYKVNVLNGLAVANGNHVNNAGWNTGPDMSGLTAVHVFIVMLASDDPATDLNQTGLWNIGTASDSAHVPYTNGFLYDDAGSTVRQGPLNHDTNLASAYRLYEIISTSSEWTRKINGATGGNDFFTTGSNTVGCPSSPTLLAASGAGSRHKMAGLYIFSAKLSSGDRTSVIDYLNDPDIFDTSFS